MADTAFTPAERAVMAARAEAERLRGENRQLERRRAELLLEQVALTSALAETRARLADLARQATAAGPVLEAAEEWFDAGAELVGVWHLNETFHLTPDEERALMAAEARDRAAYDGLCAAVAALRAAREGVGNGGR